MNFNAKRFAVDLIKKISEYFLSFYFVYCKFFELLKPISFHGSVFKVLSRSKKRWCKCFLSGKVLVLLLDHCKRQTSNWHKILKRCLSILGFISLRSISWSLLVVFYIFSYLIFLCIYLFLSSMFVNSFFFVSIFPLLFWEISVVSLIWRNISPKLIKKII